MCILHRNAKCIRHRPHGDADSIQNFAKFCLEFDRFTSQIKFCEKWAEKFLCIVNSMPAGISFTIAKKFLLKFSSHPASCYNIYKLWQTEQNVRIIATKWPKKAY